MLSQLFSAGSGLTLAALLSYLLIFDATPMEKRKPDIHIQGQKVSRSYLSDPHVANGDFRIANRGTDSVRIHIDAVWLRLGKTRQKMEGISVFDKDREITVTDPFTVQPHSELSVSVGFPRVPVTDTQTEIYVEAAFAVQGKTIKAESPIELVQRKPLGR